MDIEGLAYQVFHDKLDYRKVTKFWDAKNLCCNLPKIQTKRPNLKGILSKWCKWNSKSEDPDQTAPLGAV